MSIRFLKHALVLQFLVLNYRKLVVFLRHVFQNAITHQSRNRKAVYNRLLFKNILINIGSIFKNTTSPTKR